MRKTKEASDWTLTLISAHNCLYQLGSTCLAARRADRRAQPVSGRRACSRGDACR
jgi:hypothetical protein